MKSKLTILLLAGLFSAALIIVLFGLPFSYMTGTKLPVRFFVLIPIVLWVSNVMMYGLHLILAFRFGRNLGISVGVIGSLLSALLQTGLGDGRWYVIPPKFSQSLD
ncbi:MAG: lantibiotic immunity ABC transporter MutG family permease subunit, partial [Barnesiella sp.]|nr:lantibiotic immunity ABC transporter MutG family permease subunit [Barnesiella sp.]